MAFTQQTLFGASISSFSLNLGWNQQQGTMSIVLVEDPDNGDSFNPVQIGGSVYFNYADENGTVVFEYGGILQAYEQTNDQNGHPVYLVTLIDPREILAGTPVVIGSYNGSTKSVWNLVNAYGYHEDDNVGAGFGGARVNESGMPWNLIRDAVSVITSAVPSVAPQYGAPLRFRGEVYRVDLSELPLAPDFYRIGGTHAYLLDMIDQLCNEAGFDYYIKLVYHQILGNIIKVKTVGRRLQPALGKISAYIGNGEGTAGSRRGYELRNEITSAFVVGGNVTALYQAYGPDIGSNVQPTGCFIWPFWGLNDAGIPIVGDDPAVSNGPEDFQSDDHSFNVPATQVNVIGIGNSYDMTIGELRAALAGESSWVSYIASKKPTLAQNIGLIGDMKILVTLKEKIKQGVAKPTDFINPQLKGPTGQVRNNPDRLENVRRLFQYVSQYANQYYGRRFMVRLPLVTTRKEDDTERLFHNYQISDAAYLEDGAQPLGLPVYYEDLFKSQDGQFQAFCRYDNANNLDLSKLRPDDYVLANNTVYMKCDVDPNFYFMNLQRYSEPRAAITTPRMVTMKYNSATEPLQNELAVVAAAMTAVMTPSDTPLVDSSGNLTLQGKQVAADNIKKTHAGGFPFAGQAETSVMPNWVAIPLKSNVLTYGPWYAIGPTGKTYFEQDEALVPWNYNGYTLLNDAGFQKISQIVTAMQVGEMGSVTVPGTPTINIGDALISNGPNITGIDVQIGEGGVLTTYTLRTYTPKIGAFAKSNADRLARLVKLHQQVKRSLKQLFRQNDLKKVKERSP